MFGNTATCQVVREAKAHFEEKKRIYESVLLKFHGVDGYDVYNCSIPFMYKGKNYIFGRIEKREYWARSHVRLFEETGKDEYTVVPNGLSWLLEDPFVANIGGQAVFGGTRVRKNSGHVFTYYCDFYVGSPENGVYFTTGPDMMKDVRLVELADKRIGVFSRPKTDSFTCIGFTIIDKIEDLVPKVVEEAPPLNVLHVGAWGGVNQAYLLSSGKLGCIGHYSYNCRDAEKKSISVYLNYSFILDPETREAEREMIIGTMGCYPKVPLKAPRLSDCAFTSGIVMRDDGKCDLYSGLGDTHEGRITIDYPFEGYGEIVSNLEF